MNLDVAPIVEFVVKIPIDKISVEYLPNLIGRINETISMFDTTQTDFLMVRSGSTIYSIKLPINSLERLLQAFRKGKFDNIKVHKLYVIRSLSKTETIHRPWLVKRNSLIYLIIFIVLCLSFLLLMVL